ncbi:MAG: carbon storage regulator CsrA [Bacillota bacterium]
MLVLTRKLNQSIVIGDQIRVTLLEIEGDKVKLGIEAPRDVPVHRLEIYQAIEHENLQATRFEPGIAVHLDELPRPGDNNIKEKDGDKD